MNLAEFEKLEGERCKDLLVMEDDSGFSVVWKIPGGCEVVADVTREVDAQWIAACSVMVPKLIRVARAAAACRDAEKDGKGEAPYEEIEEALKDVGL